MYVVNPLTDRRWDYLVAGHEQSSAFHQRGWLEALCRTYGYQPFAVTSSPENEELTNGIVLCLVSSWLTGSRWVSLPFSDHCEPLLSGAADWSAAVNWLRGECDRCKMKYFELRPASEMRDFRVNLNLNPSRSYCFHELDLRATPEEIFQGFHKDCIQRKIRRAEKEKLSHEAGISDQLVDEFYQLVLRTRKRQQLIPQPRAWFRNLVACLGDKVQIRVVRKNATPVAAMLCLRHRSTVVYKYGCSNEEFHNLGGMPFLFWRLIEESKADGVEKIDLGRSDLDQQSLIIFKDRLGAVRKSLTYYRYPQVREQKAATPTRSVGLRRLLDVLPGVVTSTAGRLLYRHVG